jgi:hypothetical protein
VFLVLLEWPMLFNVGSNNENLRQAPPTAA